MPALSRASYVLTVVALCLWVLVSRNVSAGEELTLSVGDQELVIHRYPAQGKQLIIWVAPSWGSRELSFQLIDDLANAGIEVWHVDLLDSLFLQRSSNSMRSLSGAYVAELVRYARQQTAKSIFLLSRSYGAVPLLRGARDWQLANPTEKYLKGAIIFSPDLYRGAPELGLQPEYLPIVDATNISLVIFQGAKRGNRWQLDSLVEHLQKGGSQVFVNVLKDVNSVFFEPSRAEPSSLQMAQIRKQILWTLNLLEKMPSPQSPVKFLAKVSNNPSVLDDKLKPYRANPVPKTLSLKDALGREFVRQDYQNKVTVVNFWATWCRPCVKEIPSLNNLRRVMKDKPFELISVNYAESAEEIRAFMQTVNVDFPVLMDTDGRVSADWQVVVFPSTFVIGQSGRIEFGVNAGLEWDDKDIINKLTKMLPAQ